MGSGIQAGNLHSINTTKSTDVDQHYINFTPTLNFQYLFTKTKNLRINYPGQNRAARGQPVAADPHYQRFY